MKHVQTLYARQKHFFQTNQTKPLTFRLKQLQKLKQMLQKHESQIYQSLQDDLNKPPHETLTTELGFLYLEIDFILKHLKSWMQPIKVKSPITHRGTKNYIYSEPYGVALIIAPWNYPLQLSLSPLIGAIAAGNCVVLKPSEFAKSTSQLLAKMIKNTFSEEYIAVIEGDKEISQNLLSKSFDYIFFTGSSQVGKIVMEKASRFLTPVTLELGGKSPTIVDSNADIKLAAKRIIWGKFTNAGQTCVAPDFVYVHEKVRDKLLKAMKKYIKQFYSNNPLTNSDYVKIINQHHFERLRDLLNGVQITHGGELDSKNLRIEPTLVENVTWEDPLMQEEIFGPILPILTYFDLNDVISQLQEKEKPLAFYYFGNSDDTFESIQKQISFGGGCMNDSLYHLANPHLPFGGVGPSGMGSYHGKYSFKTFSHQKSIMKQTTSFDLPFRYPGKNWTEKVIKKIMK